MGSWSPSTATNVSAQACLSASFSSSVKVFHHFLLPLIMAGHFPLPPAPSPSPAFLSFLGFPQSLFPLRDSLSPSPFNTLLLHICHLPSVTGRLWAFLSSSEKDRRHRLSSLLFSLFPPPDAHCLPGFKPSGFSLLGWFSLIAFTEPCPFHHCRAYLVS